MIPKEVKQLAKRLNFRPPDTRVNVSVTSVIRSKCRYCMSGPVEYFVQGTPVKWYSPRRITEMCTVTNRFVKRFCGDFYLIEDPKNFTGVNSFTWAQHGKSYNPALHRKRGIIAVDDPMEFLSCECNRTLWGFIQKAAHYRREISQRKARYKYPKKFEDWF